MAESKSQSADRRSAERKEAERIYLDSGGEKKLVDIARDMNLPDNKVRKWKSMDKWDDKLTNGRKKKSVERSTSKKGERSTGEKKGAPSKGGAPKGNQNAKGGRGNPHPVGDYKHGAYTPVYLDALDEDEQGLVDAVPEDEELLLIDQIRLFSIRERRILKAINKYRDAQGEVAVMDVTRMDDKRTFANEKEEAAYKKINDKKVQKGEKLPGTPYHMQTHTQNKDMIIARLEQELTTVQRSKTKAIEALYKLRLENRKLDMETSGNDAVDDWIKAIVGED